MNRIRSYLSLALVGSVVLGLFGIAALSMMGGKVSTVFTAINSGLDGGPGSAPGPYAAEAPQPLPEVAAPAGMALQPTPVAAPPPPAANAPHPATPLKAGQLDDNADFAAYPTHLGAYHGPPARPVDV